MPYALNPLDPSFSEEDVARLSEETLALQIPEGYEITEREIERLDELARKHKAPFDVEDEESAAVALDWFLERGISPFDPGLEPNQWLPENQLERIERGDLVSYGQLSQGSRRDDYHTVPVYLIDGATGSDYSGGTVALSNYQVLYEMAYGDEPDEDDFDDEQLLFQKFMIFISGGHGTRGIALRLDQGPIPQELLEAVEALGEGTVFLDEDHHSNLELEMADADWGRTYGGRYEWLRFLMAAFPDYADSIEDLNEEDADALWEGVSGHLSESPYVDESMNVIYPFDEALQWIDIEDIEDLVGAESDA